MASGQWDAANLHVPTNRENVEDNQLHQGDASDPKLQPNPLCCRLKLPIKCMTTAD